MKKPQTRFDIIRGFAFSRDFDPTDALPRLASTDAYLSKLDKRIAQLVRQSCGIPLPPQNAEGIARILYDAYTLNYRYYVQWGDKMALEPLANHLIEEAAQRAARECTRNFNENKTFVDRKYGPRTIAELPTTGFQLDDKPTDAKVVEF